MSETRPVQQSHARLPDQIFSPVLTVCMLPVPLQRYDRGSSTVTISTKNVLPESAHRKRKNNNKCFDISEGSPCNPTRPRPTPPRGRSGTHPSRKNNKYKNDTRHMPRFVTHRIYHVLKFVRGIKQPKRPYYEFAKGIRGYKSSFFHHLLSRQLA